MRKKIAIAIAVLLVLGAGGLYGFVEAKSSPRFELPATGIRASQDPAVIARGEYLVHGPMHCTTCHVGSLDEFKAKVQQGQRVAPAGGLIYAAGPMATMRMPNLTGDPDTGLGKKSDEHLARVLKHGVAEDGRLMPMMALAGPAAADEDIEAVISYLRTLPPVVNEVEPTEYHLLGRALVAFGVFGPKKLKAPGYVPAGAEPSQERGEYLARGPAHCHGCHSPYDVMNGFALEAPLFSGCGEADPAFERPGFEVCPPNLTPHPTAGHITAWTEDFFVKRFHEGAPTEGSSMAWGNYRHLSENDLRSIFRYLRSLPPSDRVTGPTVREAGWKPKS